MNKNIQTIKQNFVQAIAEYKKKNFESARVICEKILNIDSNHFDSIFLLSNLAAMGGDFKKTKKLLIRAIALQPNNVSAQNNLGNTYKELNDFKNAIKCYEQTIKIKHNHPNAHFNLGIIYYKLNQLKEAKNYFEQTIKIQPNYALAYFNLGNILTEHKDYKTAKKLFQKVIDLSPDYASAHNNLGLIFRISGEYEKAISCYKKTIELQSNHTGAFNNLGMAYKELGDFKNAINSHEMAIKLEPENLYHYFYLSELKKDFLDNKLIDKVKNITNNNKSSKINLAFGNFLLARYENKIKNYDKEFSYLLKAHSNYFDTKKRKFDLGVKYVFNELIEIKDSISVKKTGKSDGEKIRPIFIVGVPRCGSTLVEKIIASGQSSIPIGEETAIIENYINSRILKLKSVDLGETEEVRNEILEIYSEKGLVKKEKNFMFTDKSLNNFFYIPFLLEVFPSAKIINCKRNTLASIMSILQNNLTELAWAHDLKNIFRYFDLYFNVMNKFLKKYENFIYEVNFEKFTQNPEQESKKLMKFCGLKWDKKCLEFYKRKDIVSKTTSFQQIRKAVYKHPEERYLPYKKFLSNYEGKYPWF
tara:strand:+ start:2892 stop:4655 length:1764 start_codon:yes stop_codon:yes gene_type:complete